MSSPRISVIFPNYNGSRYIREAIDSVRKQTYSDWELILIDDASTDESVDIIKEYAAMDSRIKPVFSPSNNQICYALNLGLVQAQGDYIARIDSDDIWLEDKLEKQLAYMESHPECGACFSWVDLINEEGNVVNNLYPEVFQLFMRNEEKKEDWIKALLKDGNCLNHSSVFFRRKLLEKTGYYSLAFVQIQDYDLWMRFLQHTEIHKMKEVLVRYRWTPKLGENISAASEENNSRVFNEYFFSIKDFFDGISNEAFAAYFGDEFLYRELLYEWKNLEEKTLEMAIKCEKAFWCSRGRGELCLLGIMLLEEVIREKEGLAFLQEHYHYTLKDFYGENGKHYFYDRELHSKMQVLENTDADMINENFVLKEKLSQHQRRIEDLEAANNQAVSMLNMLLNSTSWKATKPLRAFVQILKCIKHYTKKQVLILRKFLRSFGKPVIWLLGTEDYGNLGDHKIAIGERHFIQEYFPKYKVVEITARRYWEMHAYMEKKMKDKDLILGHGGGNLGNQYPAAEAIRRDFISRFPNNRIIILPQTIYFTPEEQGRQEYKNTQELYSRHQKLLITVREQYSYELGKHMFGERCILAPDMVLFEKPWSKKIEAAGKKVLEKKYGQAVLCLRSDIESVIQEEDKKTLLDIMGELFETVTVIDTQKDYYINAEQREGEVNSFLSEIAASDFMVTDRLHGMVFAALAKTPCLVFDNYNSKVKGIYQWIEKLPYIEYAGKPGGRDIMMEQIKKLASMKKSCVYEIDGLKEKFDTYADWIRTNSGLTGIP